MESEDNIFILGAGGHGKVVLSTLITSGKQVKGFLDENFSLHGKDILGYKVLGDFSLLADKPNRSAILALGDNALRKKISAAFENVNWISVIHPNAYVHDSVVLGLGTVIFAGAVIQPHSIIEDHVIVNTGATIDHDCIINSFVHIAPGVHIAGEVQIQEGSFVGMGSNIIPGISIGKWTTIGAGSVVIDSIPENTQAKGVPAKVYKVKTKIF